VVTVLRERVSKGWGESADLLLTACKAREFDAPQCDGDALHHPSSHQSPALQVQYWITCMMVGSLQH